MASPIDIACPACKKPMKAPAELQGKKVRCKGCNHVFAVAPPKSRAVDDDDDPNPYGVIREDESIPRCPQCANLMQSAEAVLCLHCGFNLKTRQRLGTKKVIETSGQEHFAWLLPGILCVAGILALIGFDLFYCLAAPGMARNTDYEWLTYGGFRLWVVIATLFGMAFLGKFAYQRLIVNPTPPEVEKEL